MAWQIALGAVSIFAALAIILLVRARKVSDREHLEAIEIFAFQQSMLETAVRQINDGIIILDADGQFALINEAAKQTLGVTTADLEMGHYDEVVSGFSEKLQREAILNTASEGISEVQVAHGGGIFRLRFTGLKLSGQEMGALCVISDITESFKAEDMQTDFVANVSHELKTPLTTVKSYAETLLAGGLEDAKMSREFLEIIDSEADRMGRLVRDLLLMSRLEDKEHKWDFAENDLAMLIKTVMKKLDGPARGKQLTVNRMFDEEAVEPVDMDRDRMEQVIHNILSNAIKYTNEKGRIDVDLVPAGNCIQIVISDNGVGIPEKDQARVFERFFTVDKARSRSLGGTGLGLAISKQIVEGHGGTIGIESKAGKGTTVTVTLPKAWSRGERGIQ
ncbi:MAG: cell wall metabolism sensor histidine kinase WalK [Clostridiales Family XIII bacterium]|jgi:two-component system sensor histidine kinase VicK|nr:cell wall metabolism sensor histidine kinase WalK [Clostridiales Family XIII bacterium]